jgi:hypothetical protein
VPERGGQLFPVDGNPSEFVGNNRAYKAQHGWIACIRRIRLWHGLWSPAEVEPTRFHHQSR